MPTWLKNSWKSIRRTSWIILKTVLPWYLAVDVLMYLGALGKIAFVFSPVSELLRLPNEAALSLAGGVLFNLYAGLAFAAPLGLSPEQWTTIAVFLSICHSVPIEASVVAKLGVRPLYAISLRLGCALIGGFVISRIGVAGTLPSDALAPAAALAQFGSFWEMLASSLLKSGALIAKICALIAVIILFFDLLKNHPLTGPLLRRSGQGITLAVGLLLGITYGAGVLLQENERGEGTRFSRMRVLVFLILAHGLIEETGLFLIFGASAAGILAVRCSMALLATGIFHLLGRRDEGDAPLALGATPPAQVSSN